MTFDDNDGVDGVDETGGAQFTKGSSTVILPAGQCLNSWGGLPTVAWTDHTFEGWKTEAGKDFTKMIAVDENMTITAHWSVASTPLNVTLTFDAGKDTLPDGAPASITAQIGGTASGLPVPERIGYTFGGWYTDEACSNDTAFTEGETTVDDNMTLYAKWTANEYAVTLDAMGGTFDDGKETRNVKATFGSELGELPEPSYEGYEFLGWYLDAACTEQLVRSGDATDERPAMVFSEDITLHAKWMQGVSGLVSADGDSMTVTYNGEAQAPKLVFDDTFPADEQGKVTMEFRPAGSADEDA